MAPPIFNLDFSTPHRPTVSSPLSSSPIRASQSSPLSPRDINTLPRRDILSSPIRGPPTKSKYAARDTKPNPLRVNREKAQEGRRTLFLKNVRQRSDQKKWEQRGGDQEALMREWNVINKQRRQEKDADVDGIVFEGDLDDIPEEVNEESDDMMVDSIAQDEEAEMDAMLSLLQSSASQQEQPSRPDSIYGSDDEDYDALFMDMMNQQEGNSASHPSNDMDMS
ncbi:hypothetical protein F5Y18DRAFT_421756 [Xylariaceae sp. FL1019]|nr:hypothetical protein F5Y18DRAFT_421756 [Xylariaceae sp. FL1019]